MVSKLEGSFTTKVLTQLRKHYPTAVVIKIADRITLGVPDTCVTYSGGTSWWEMKVIRDRDSWSLKGLGKGIQLNTSQRMASQGVCYYMVFVDRTNDQRILIVDPSDIMISEPIASIKFHDYIEAAESLIDIHLEGLNLSSVRARLGRG